MEIMSNSFVKIVNLADSLSKLSDKYQDTLFDARDKAVTEAVEYLLQENATYQDALNELELLNGAIDDCGFYQTILNHASKKIKAMAMNAEV